MAVIYSNIEKAKVITQNIPQYIKVRGEMLLFLVVMCNVLLNDFHHLGVLLHMKEIQ